MKIISNSLKETEDIAKIIVNNLKEHKIICLYGDLGSGKTILTQNIAKLLGIKNYRIKSPTYTYIRKYSEENINLYHIDLYRLESIDEILANEILELFENEKNIVIIEWANKMEEYLPNKRLNIFIEYLNAESREFKISL